MFIINKTIKIVVPTLSLIFCIASFLGSAVAGQTQKELLKAANTKANGEYVRAGFLNAMKITQHPNANKTALIIGDSHAQDFFNAAIENNYLKNYQITTRYIPTRCQIYLGDQQHQFIATKDKVLCKKSDNLAQAKEEIAKADLIILSSKWRKWAALQLPQTIKKLAIKPQQKLVVVGTKSFGRISIRKYLRMSDKTLLTLRNEIDGNQNEINEIMKENINPNVFVNTHQLICGSGTTCPLFTKELKLITFDGGHLTKAGANYIGKVLFQGRVLNTLK
jgi:hypothetical protein